MPRKESRQWGFQKSGPHPFWDKVGDWTRRNSGSPRNWSEVDLDAGWISRPRGRQKTGVPLRVPILPRLAEALKPVRATSGLVVTLPAYDDGYTSLKRLFARCGVRTRGGWHALRAGFGTLLGETGAQQAVIGRALSHRPGSAVTGRYVRPDDAALLAAMRRAGERLGGA